MMKHAHDPALPILNGKSDVNLSFATFRVVCNARWGYLVFAKVEDHLVCDAEVFKVVHEILLCLLLGEDLTFCKEIGRL